MNLVIFLEEPSAKAMLEGLLPRILPDNMNVQFIVFEGKQGMIKRLKYKLRGWLVPNTCFIVLIDKDANDCIKLKEQISEICRKSHRPETLIRIVCHELESWYLGDLQAVETALDISGISTKQKSKYHSPDTIEDPKGELKRLTEMKYQQIDGSRKIGKVLSPTVNSSKSYEVFISGIQRIATQGCLT